jgi:hypothetical protein
VPLGIPLRILDETELVLRKAKHEPLPDCFANFSITYPTVQISEEPREYFDEIALKYFHQCFLGDAHTWPFLHGAQLSQEPLVRSAMQACGMATLYNSQNVSGGREQHILMHSRTIRLLERALDHPTDCKSDSVLTAVALLGFYDNLTCEDSDVAESWRAHVSAASKLVQLRGKEQLRSAIGRALYRELRSQLLIDCLWADRRPTSFLIEWQDELSRETPMEERQDFAPSDALHSIVLDFADLRFQMRECMVTPANALGQLANLARQADAWARETAKLGEAWQITSDHHKDCTGEVWVGLAHRYSNNAVAATWNSYRTLRIMLTRAQEIMVLHRADQSSDDLANQIAALRKARKFFTDEICASVPSQLGHLPLRGSKETTSALYTAFALIWPLFFAATCALDQVGEHVQHATSASHTSSQSSADTDQASVAVAQASWLINRLSHISNGIGLKWAGGFIEVLHGDFRVFQTYILP